MTIVLGCIADDFTGGTDLAGTLVKAGMRTIQMIGVPQGAAAGDGDIDAVVIALKSRTVPVDEAVAQSLAALRWLKQAGARQFYFKYCSTFDSTAEGNIGPVVEALLDELGQRFTVVCPAFPANRRTVYQGHLFVGDQLLSDSGMRDHPLTPMTDANLVRVLQAQVKAPVGLADYAVVRRGAKAIGERFAALQTEGRKFAVVDAVDDNDLIEIGQACAELQLVTGGSGLALGLPQNFRNSGWLSEQTDADALPQSASQIPRRAVLSGSCSQATQAQVAVMTAAHPAFRVDPLALANGVNVVAAALDWAASRIDREPILIYATASPTAMRSTQEKLGVARAAELIEAALAQIARGLLKLGVNQLIVAGGETSGAVVKGLGIAGLRIGPEIAPGVPWTSAIFDAKQSTAAGQPLYLALKSGNFGGPDFFLNAWSKLP